MGLCIHDTETSTKESWLNLHGIALVNLDKGDFFVTYFPVCIQIIFSLKSIIIAPNAEIFNRLKNEKWTIEWYGVPTKPLYEIYPFLEEWEQAKAVQSD